MKLKEAILKILKEVKTPLLPTKVTEIIIKNKYYDFKNAPTPVSTVSALLGNFIREKHPNIKRKVENKVYVYYYSNPEKDVNFLKNYLDVKDTLTKLESDIINKFVKIYKIIEDLGLATPTGINSIENELNDLKIHTITPDYISIENSSTDSNYRIYTLESEVFSLDEEDLEEAVLAKYYNNVQIYKSTQEVINIFAKKLKDTEQLIRDSFTEEMIKTKDDVYIKSNSTISYIIKNHDLKLFIIFDDESLVEKDSFGLVKNIDNIRIKVGYSITLQDSPYREYFQKVMKDLNISHLEHYHKLQKQGLPRIPHYQPSNNNS